LADLQRTVYPHSGHPLAEDRAQDRVSSPAKDRRSANCATQPAITPNSILVRKLHAGNCNRRILCLMLPTVLYKYLENGMVACMAIIILN